MNSILRYFPAHLIRRVFPAKENPQIQGKFSLEVRDRGKLVTTREGYNIWTLTGREYLAELIGLDALSPRATFREDRVAYIGMGTGVQNEVSNITSLVAPVAYRTGEFLAALAMPATFPTSGSSTTTTAVRFVREFAPGEVSLGFNVVLTEAGLFTDGDPDDDWNTSSPPTDFATAASRAPVAYKTYEPVSKTTQLSVRVIWDVRFI